MEESLKNLFYHGLGVVAITKDKLEKAVEELVQKGKMTQDEGRKFYEDLKAETGKAGQEFRDTARDTSREWLEKTGIPSREEFDALKARVDALEAQLQATKEA